MTAATYVTIMIGRVLSNPGFFTNLVFVVDLNLKKVSIVEVRTIWVRILFGGAQRIILQIKRFVCVGP